MKGKLWGRRALAMLVSVGCMTAAAGASAADKIKVGLLTTLSGPGAALGNEIRDGFNLALQHTGGKLGGLPAEVVVADDQQKADAGRQAVERLLKRDKVNVMTGIVFSNVLLPVMPAILQSGTIYLSTNTGPENYAGAGCNPNFFAVAWQNEDIPAAMGKYAADQGFKRVALIAPDYPGGRESLNGFKRLYKGGLSEEIYTQLGQLDYGVEITRLRASKPDAVFFFLPGGMGVNFIKQFNGAGLGKEIALLAPGFSGDEDTIAAVGAPIEGLHNSSQWAADLDNPANRKFVEDFRKTYNRTPTLYASQGYDAAMLLDSAVRQTGGKLGADALRPALRRADFKSVRGDFTFNRNQYPIQNYYLRTIVKGADGKLANKLSGTVLTQYHDPFAAACQMK
ncbi:ABC transporter substrate-binding protein [Achromobacter ruhlandii]|uniref:ABC transporter substrate-binding protein n=1 Tax=Achromobacter ruhlandii TaxID=72557 RepID=UPI0021F0AC81|nr:ABC transporter substrate-binding protein [Achromobacter ruhlandii]MCV6800013.1 ABC transporter substrate-binding protein [Achromobacter ruhlandii]MCV6803815.1 ABC transporter substrate-binding protein [Achromobacter ruhlandii]MCV6811136.1 ABC transporter substrate-binding protein [Achromobacter ruhlandii]MCV6821106.1 ABC transporter substrate-binding protein [Achromobacter ruhlandii]